MTKSRFWCKNRFDEHRQTTNQTSTTMSIDKSLKKALRKELEEEARTWAKNEALGGLFGWMSILWVLAVVASGWATHRYELLILTPTQIMLWSIGICLVPIWWAYSLRRNKRIRSTEFRHVILENLKKRLKSLHEKHQQRKLMDDDRRLIFQEIQVAEGLYTEITSSVYKDTQSSLDTPTPSPKGKVPKEYLEDRGSRSVGIGAGCTPPQRIETGG